MSVPTGAPDITGVFVSYNQAVSPAQIGLLALAIALIALARRGTLLSTRFLYAGLATLWAWCAIVFALTFMAPVMPVAFYFGFAYLLQGGAFTAMIVRARGGAAAPPSQARMWTGWAMIAYALGIYPVLGAALGHGYPAGPTFGAPCPLTIYTFGVLLLATEATPAWLVVIPAAWSIVGSFAIVRWGVLEDIALPIAGITGTVLLLLKARTARLAEPAVVGETPALAGGIRRLH